MTAQAEEPARSAPARRRARPARLRRDLCAILGDGATFSVMVGVGETYLPAFVLAAGMGEVAAGLITTIPLLAGAFLQLATPEAVRRLGSYRRWVLICAISQTLSFLPLVGAIAVGRFSPLLVFAMAAIYWAAGMGTGAAWNTWVGTIVPGPIRAHYFARRTRISQAGVLVGFLGGGFALHAGKSGDFLLPAFAGLFVVAAVCRAASAGFLAIQSEPVPPSSEHRHVPFLELAGRFRGGADGSLLIYLLSVQAAAQVAGPYFTPFMLKHLKFSYVEYVLLIGSSFAAKIFLLPTLGRFARQVGARRLLWLGGIGVVPMSALWLVSQNFAFLIMVQILAGASWAAYELAMFLLFFETIREEERTSVLTTYNLGNAVATVLGSVVGGGVLLAMEKSHDAYLVIFALSSAGRLATMLLLARVPEVIGQAAPLATRTLELRADTGSVDGPILASLPKGSSELLKTRSAPADGTQGDGPAAVSSVAQHRNIE